MSQRVFFSYFRCGNCGALYCQTFYAQDQLESLYNRQTENMAEVPLEARQRTQIRYARLLMKYSTRTRGFLEIGPDIGLLAEQCARIGDFDKLWLYEPNYTVHSELATRLKTHPHIILPTMSPTSDLAHESVSTAAMIHVLDHLLDPRLFLAELRDKLTENGVVLIVTHNTASLLARLFGKRWPPFALQHPQLYSPKSITRLLERAGFSIVEIAPAVNYFPIMHLLRAGFAILGAQKIMPQTQGAIIPIKLGNMAVIARKRTLH
jgi:2-polyprenyl-3-methyl-5-hydroxy-6-metoxy-1,4-benzoquinol methylase